jgi:hypothetical protein
MDFHFGGRAKFERRLGGPEERKKLHAQASVFSSSSSRVSRAKPRRKGTGHSAEGEEGLEKEPGREGESGGLWFSFCGVALPLCVSDFQQILQHDETCLPQLCWNIRRSDIV